MSRLIIIGVVLLVAVLIFVIVFIAVNRSRSAARGAHPSSRRRPVAPDDDPEFLRNLNLPDPPTDDDQNTDDRG